MIPKVSGVNDTTIIPSHQLSVSPEDRSAHFTPLAKIKAESIISLALRIRRKWAKKGNQEQANEGQSQDYNCALTSPLKYGTLNLLHTLEFSDGVKWTLRIPCLEEVDRFTSSNSGSWLLRPEVMTMQFIQKLTSIPIPEVYDYDETIFNEIGTPYIIMEFIEGYPVCEMWFDLTGPTPMEERRLRILDTVAAAMSQLQGFQFERIGSLRFWDGGSFEVSECKVTTDVVDLESDEVRIGAKPSFKDIGPFRSSREYFFALLDAQKIPQDPFSIGVHKILRLMIGCTPASIQPGASCESFVLAHPSFDPQSFLVSEDGTLTAIIGWDNIHTLPRSIGYARYPSWITRDWNPLMYDYDTPDSHLENSPEELDYYRHRYAERMKAYMPEGIDFTTKSHLFEAMWIAARSPIYSHHIVQKIFDHLFPEAEEIEEEFPIYLYETALAMAEGTLKEEEEERMLEAFYGFFCVDLVDIRDLNAVTRQGLAT